MAPTPQCGSCSRYMTYLGRNTIIKEGINMYEEKYQCFSCSTETSIERHNIHSDIEKIILNLSLCTKVIRKAA